MIVLFIIQFYCHYKFFVSYEFLLYTETILCEVLWLSTSVHEASENHGYRTKAMYMYNSSSHSNSTSKPEDDRYQRSTTVSDVPEAETGSNEAMHNSSSHWD